MKSVPKGRRPVKRPPGGIPLIHWLWILYLAYNGLVFLFYLVDKWKARTGRWRVPEATLLWLALSGGAAGATLAIYLVRHKTRKPIFARGVPAMLAAHAALFLFIVR